jgi:hypothetical protein
MDEETKKAILESRDILAELLALTKEQKTTMEARAKGSGVDEVLKKIFETLPPQMRAMMNNVNSGVGP